ncbi:MAG: hypothetical protein V4543_00395 [Bacteroidota bacterium]
MSAFIAGSLKDSKAVSEPCTYRVGIMAVPCSGIGSNPEKHGPGLPGSIAQGQFFILSEVKNRVFIQVLIGLHAALNNH